jgi:hypothetical protein
MNRVVISIGALALSLACACEKGSKAAGNPGAQAPQGLPGSGSGTATGPGPGGLPPGAPGMGGGVDPHAGLGMGGPGGADPHAGLDMGGGSHGDMGGMTGTSPAPQPLDPNTLLEGTIEAGPGLAEKIKPGDVIFLSAKTVDPKTGEILRGPPLAVERLTVDKLPMAFSLSNQNAMVAGTRLEGQVAIVARVDRDVEATTREPGDIEGVVKTAPPQKSLKLVLDTEVK